MRKTKHKQFTDFTSYREQKQARRKKYGYRPITYICSPYAGNPQANTRLARKLSALAVEQNKIPIAPHLLFPQFMDDTSRGQRDLAMFFNWVLLTKCHLMWVYANEISEGMKQEIAWATEMGITITYLEFDEGEEL